MDGMKKQSLRYAENICGSFEVEELIPIVGKLAGKYTSFESTSITYERAEQLMDAVKYCINEAEMELNQCPLATERIYAELMYESGLGIVQEKVRKALIVYNELLPEFESYGIHCYTDTVAKGLPEFFRWYDVKFAPQESILTLDYPVLPDLSDWSGIDRIERYIMCIRLEQSFLKQFPKVFVEKALCQYNAEYKDMIDNVCPAVITKLYAHFLLGTQVSGEELTKQEEERLGDIFRSEEMESIQKRAEGELAKLVRSQYGEEQEEILQYLLFTSKDVLLRMKLRSLTF